jgi:hypothetical protein
MLRNVTQGLGLGRVFCNDLNNGKGTWDLELTNVGSFYRPDSLNTLASTDESTRRQNREQKHYCRRENLKSHMLKIDLKEIVWEGIHLAHDMGRGRAYLLVQLSSASQGLYSMELVKWLFFSSSQTVWEPVLSYPWITYKKNCVVYSLQSQFGRLSYQFTTCARDAQIIKISVPTSLKEVGWGLHCTALAFATHSK